MRGQDCGQVVLEQYAESLGLSKDAANRLTASFGGGSGVGETCGAVVAALMVIGMKYGHSGPDDPEHRDVLMAKRAEFIEKWKHELWDAEIPCNMINVGAMMTYMNYTPRTLEEILEANPAPEFKRDLRKLSEELK